MIVSRWDRITWLRYHATVVFNPIVGKEIDRSNQGVKVTQIFQERLYMVMEGS